MKTLALCAIILAVSLALGQAGANSELALDGILDYLPLWWRE